MRKPIILIATLFLTATAAAAAPRSLSTGEPQSVELPPSKVQILEAPKPELAPPAPAAVQAEPLRTAPVAQPETRAIETTPAEVRPAIVPPPATTKSVETKSADTPPTVTDAKPPARVVQRKPRQRHAGIERRMHREFRNIERMIIPAIGFAIAGSSFYW